MIAEWYDLRERNRAEVFMAKVTTIVFQSKHHCGLRIADSAHETHEIPRNSRND